MNQHVHKHDWYESSIMLAGTYVFLKRVELSQLLGEGRIVIYVSIPSNKGFGSTLTCTGSEFNLLGQTKSGSKQKQRIRIRKPVCKKILYFNKQLSILRNSTFYKYGFDWCDISSGIRICKYMRINLHEFSNLIFAKKNLFGIWL